MPGSTPASATTTDASGGAPETPDRRRPFALRRLVRTPSAWAGVLLSLAVVVVSLLADTIAPGDPFASTGPTLAPPSSAHPMGTDNFGRDMLDAVVHGVRTSVTLALGVVAIALTLALVVGIVAGYRGGPVDDILMRIAEVFQAIPLFFLALLLVAFFGAGLENLILLLGLTIWADDLVRVIRSSALSVRRREFVEAAHAMGASEARIMLRYVLPAVLPAAIVVASLVGSRVILIEAALSFIGLGDPNTISLGYLVYNAQAFLRVAWWMSVFPGLAIAVTVLGLNLLGDVVNDALDPAAATTGRRKRARHSRRRG